MEYEQFVDEFIDKLQQNIEQENVEIRRGTFTKINEKLDGISVKYPDSSVAPTVYLDEKYQMVQDGSYTIEQVAERTAMQLQDIRGDVLEIPFSYRRICKAESLLRSYQGQQKMKRCFKMSLMNVWMELGR